MTDAAFIRGELTLELGNLRAGAQPAAAEGFDDFLDLCLLHFGRAEHQEIVTLGFVFILGWVLHTDSMLAAMNKTTSRATGSVANIRCWFQCGQIKPLMPASKGV